MPDVRFQGVKPKTLYFGSSNVSALYYGAELLWPLNVNIFVPANFMEWGDFSLLSASGVSMEIPSDVAAWADFVAGVSIGTLVNVPADTVVLGDFAPVVSIGGAAVFVPYGSMEITDFTPSIASGTNVAIPTDSVQWLDMAPQTGVATIVTVPVDVMSIVGFAPAIHIGVKIDLPTDAVVISDFVPAMSITVDISSDEAEWGDYAPMIASGVNLSIPASLMAWRDFGVVAGYGFSAGFSKGFNALPGAAGSGVFTDEMAWREYAPTVVAAVLPVIVEPQTLMTVSAQTPNIINATGVAIGAEDPNRRVFVFVHSSKELVNASINGVAAIIHRQVFNSSVATALISAPVATETTATVSLTFIPADPQYWCFLKPYRVTGLLSDTAIDTDTFSGGSGDAVANVSLDVVENGILLAAASMASAQTGTTVSGVIEDYDSSGGFNLRIAGGSFAVINTQAGRSVSFTRTGGGGSIYVGAIVAASFR